MTREEQIAQLETEWMAQGKIASYTNWLQDQLLAMRERQRAEETAKCSTNPNDCPGKGQPCDTKDFK